MAKVHLDRLKKRYHGLIEGETYSEIIKVILDQNNQNVMNKQAKISQSKWESLSRKITTKEKRLVMPDIKDIVPPQALSVMKSAEKGEMIKDTLRDSLTRDLRMSLDEFNISGKEAYIKRRGTTAGRISPQLLKDFERRMTDTFSHYTKKDPKVGMPSSVHRIAVTEVRSAINNVKKTYTDKMLEKNPDIQAKKKWIHNRSLSKEPRRGHQQLDGKTIEINDSFKVPNYKMKQGKLVLDGYNLMKFPHDPDAPADQVISCNCDYDIIVSRRKK